MIKKTFLLVVIVLAGTLMLNAQCTPNVACATMVCPDTITNLPHATVSVAYSTTMTVVVPPDTVVPPFGTVVIDSLNFNSVTGLPAGYTVSPNDLGWLGGTSGCILISGTTATAGTYPLTINTTIHAMSGLVSMPLAFTGYKIIVDPVVGISDGNLQIFSLEQNSPNPFSNNTLIVFNSPKNENYNFKVCNLLGDVVFEQSVNAVTGENTIDFSAGSLSSGIYMYKLSNEEHSITKRMLVEEK